MKKLRIAVWHNLPSGGGKRQLYNHVSGLVERGHFVESWCPETADQKYLPLGKLIREHIIPLERRRDSYHSPVRPFSVTRELLTAMEHQCQACAEEINKGEFDVVFANACMFLRTTPIAGYVNVPTALYLGEPFRWFYEAMPELPWIAPLGGNKIGLSMQSLSDAASKWSSHNTIRSQARAELEYTRKFDQVLVNSQYSRETVLRTYNLESKVCYLGIDTNYYKPTGEAKEKFVVGLGTIYHGKGVDRAIRAIATIPKPHRPPLIWIGNGASEADLNCLNAMARELGVDFVPKVHIPDNEVVSLLSRATAMVYTSRLEPFGLAPLEANACGTPVVGIAEGGVRETIRDGQNGFLAIDDDPQHIGRLVSKFMADPQLSSEMGKRARAYVKTTWNMRMCTDNIETFLQDLARKGSTRKLLADRALLQRIEPTDDIRMNLEEFGTSRNRLRGKGWAFIDDGVSARESSIYILVRNGSETQLLPTNKKKRMDVTEYFGNEVDYSDSGFTMDCNVSLPTGSSMGILVARGEKISFQHIDVNR